MDNSTLIVSLCIEESVQGNKLQCNLNIAFTPRATTNTIEIIKKIVFTHPMVCNMSDDTNMPLNCYIEGAINRLIKAY